MGFEERDPSLMNYSIKIHSIKYNKKWHDSPYDIEKKERNDSEYLICDFNKI